MKMNEAEQDKVKEQIITKEVKEMELLRDLRAVRGKIEKLRRELEKI